MEKPQKPVAVIVIIIVLIVGLLAFVAIKTLEPKKENPLESPDWVFRQKLWDKINQDLEQARILNEEGDHLQAGILLSEVAAVQSVFENELGADNSLTGENAPTFTEALARMQFFMAGKAEGYEKLLKLKYPKWYPDELNN